MNHNGTTHLSILHHWHILLVFFLFKKKKLFDSTVICFCFDYLFLTYFFLLFFDSISVLLVLISHLNFQTEIVTKIREALVLLIFFSHQNRWTTVFFPCFFPSKIFFDSFLFSSSIEFWGFVITMFFFVTVTFCSVQLFLMVFSSEFMFYVVIIITVTFREFYCVLKLYRKVEEHVYDEPSPRPPMIRCIMSKRYLHNFFTKNKANNFSPHIRSQQF